MTPQPNQQAHPEARIDQLLDALRTTQPPAGMEERIAQRIAARMEQAEARQSSPAQLGILARTASTTASFFAVILAVAVVFLFVIPQGSAVAFALVLAFVLAFAVAFSKNSRIWPAQTKVFATAAVSLALLAALSVLHFRTSTTQLEATTAFNRETPSTATTQVAQGFSPGSHRVHQEAGVLTPAVSQTAHSTPPVSTRKTPSAATLENVATTQVPQGFSLGSHSAHKTAGGLTPASAQPDPDAIALAETLAPTRAAAPEPLTRQEQLIASATRPGQPIQLAELDTARAPFLRAEARARTDAAIKHYVNSLLAPFAVADALQPTTFAQPREISTPAPAPQPQTSLSN